MFTGIVSHIGIVKKISHPDDWELSVDVINDNNTDNDFNINRKFLKYFASKGSVSIDGVSLTVNDVYKDFFTVNIVPFTWLHTSFKNYKTGTVVNIEIDILVRYLESLNAI